MKAFNLQSEKRTVADREVSVIALGESGRGRQLTLVNCELGIDDGSTVELKRPRPGMPGKPRISKSANSGADENYWLARISTDGAYVRGAQGNVRFWHPEDKFTELVAKGYGAFGDAGRTGNWDDVLLIVPVDTLLRVKPTRADAYFLLFKGDKVSRLSAAEADLLELPTDKEEFIRL